MPQEVADITKSILLNGKNSKLSDDLTVISIGK